MMSETSLEEFEDFVAGIITESIENVPLLVAELLQLVPGALSLVRELSNLKISD